MADFLHRQYGFKIGLTTSPHLMTVRERISINKDEIISENMFAKLFAQIKQRETLLWKHSQINSKLSRFEIFLLIALKYFEIMKCDIVILEVGIGGKYDTTNEIQFKNEALLCAIIGILNPCVFCCIKMQKKNQKSKIKGNKKKIQNKIHKIQK